ncbi:MAG TPA: hypothetical protein VGC54_15065 [Planctomycetota bacterium]
MFRPSRSSTVLPALALAAASLWAPSRLAGQGFELNPGEVLIADSAGTRGGAIRVLRGDGSVDVLFEGQPLYLPCDVGLDRDGAVLLCNWSSQSWPANGIYRLDPGTGAIAQLNTDLLHDPFKFTRDGHGELVVGDGFRGLVRLHQDGTVTQLAPPSFDVDPVVGVLLDYDHSLVYTEAPSVFWPTNDPPGKLFRFAAGGPPTLVARDGHVLVNPLDVVLDRDGTYLVSDANDYSGHTQRHGLVRVGRDGRMHTVTDQNLLFPAGTEVAPRGIYLIADKDLQAVLALLPDGTMHELVSDFSDGDPSNGLPVDRPYDVAMVPLLWLRTEWQAMAGQVTEVEIRSLRREAGRSVWLAASPHPGPSPLAQWWPGDLQNAHLDLNRAMIFFGVLDAQGGTRFRVPVAAGLAGQALHLQAFLPFRRRLSNPVSLPVR